MKIEKKLQGVVVKLSDKSTASVEVVRKVAHSKYHKFYKISKKYLVDYEDGLNVGDTVEITSVKPISKNKSFKVSKVLKGNQQLSRVQEEEI